MGKEREQEKEKGQWQNVQKWKKASNREGQSKRTPAAVVVSSTPLPFNLT